MEENNRRLRYQSLDFSYMKLFILTDGSFVNNKDIISQVGFLIVLAEEEVYMEKIFNIQGNIIYWISTRCKRVIRNVFVSELYGMTTGFDNGIVLNITFVQIINIFGIVQIPIMICSDSRSLYDYLVKFGNTTEKRLMIDIMSFWESYERQEILEFRWIDGWDNPVDTSIKKEPNPIFITLVSTNRINIQIQTFVERLDKGEQNSLEHKQFFFPFLYMKSSYNFIK